MKPYDVMLDTEIKRCYDLANQAHNKGYDPDDTVDIPLAKNMAERVEGIISVVAPQIKGSGIVERMIALENQYGNLDWRVALTVALEVAEEKFCKFASKTEAMEVGIRVGLAYITVGVVVSPLEGFVKLQLNKRNDNGKEYFCLFYSGPIRSAGGTAAAVSVIIADYIRKKMGYATYDPDVNELKRAYVELTNYHDRVTNLQYFPSEAEVEFMVSNLPLQINGDPSEEFEVSNYKDLPRIETNRIRNGFCLVVAECLCSKAKKVSKQLTKWGKDFELDNWNFLNEFLQIQKKSKSLKTKEEGDIISPDNTFIKDIVAGRPVITSPLAAGGLRLRYGRCRTSGFSSDAIHPATMAVLHNYVAIGTQLKTERPGKATTISVCDSLEGPIVRLKDGSVVFLDTAEKALNVNRDIEEVLFLGDILINYGDFLNRNHKLLRSGFCEEWWVLYLEKYIQEHGREAVDLAIGKEKIDGLLSFPIKTPLKAQEAIALSEITNIPFHPRYTYHWDALTPEQFKILLLGKKEWKLKIDDHGAAQLLLPNKEDGTKRNFELLGVPHTVLDDTLIFEDNEARSLLFQLGALDQEKEISGSSPLDIINKLCRVPIKDKSGFFIGARMGRPEKAKMRKLDTSPNGLFPVGEEGGRLRSFQSALEKGKITGTFPLYWCNPCRNRTIFSVCEDCNHKTVPLYYCASCNEESEVKCTKHEHVVSFRQQEIDIQKYIKSAKKMLKEDIPELVKGVRGVGNRECVPEHIMKPILRAKHRLMVNKDGTIRYDMSEMTITHFKPKEIGTSITKLHDLGYTQDIFGKDLVEETQIVGLNPQDLILPACDEAAEDGADKILLRVAHFIDELLEKLYGLKPYYNVESRNDLIGHLVVGLSPHTSAGIIGRIIGFSKTQGFFAHPLMHSIMRRDCFSYDTYIPLFKDGIWKNVKIGELVESLEPNKKVDLFGTLAKKVNDYYTIGINQNKRICKVKINDFTKHRPSKLLRIKTSDGRTINVTKTHKFLILQENGIKKVEASRLSIGTKLVIPQKITVLERDVEFIDLKKHFASRQDVMVRNIKSFLKNFSNMFLLRKILNLKRRTLYNFISRDSFPLPLLLILLHFSKSYKLPDDCSLAIKRDKVTLPNKIMLNEDVLYVLGLYVAEGHARKNTSKKGFYQISFAATEKETREKIMRIMEENFSLEPSATNKDSITYSSRLLYELFVEILKCGSNTYEKRVPEIFMGLPLQKLRFFLQGYYDGDGSVSKTDCRVTCDTVSEGLLQDLEFCLKRYGIFTKKYWYKKKPGEKVKEFYIRKNRIIPEFAITKLIVPSNYVKIFYTQISFSLNRKQEILQYLVASTKPYGMKIKHDEMFVYPEIKEIIEEGYETTYCLNVENHVVLANGLLVGQCDGDEAGIMLLMDNLLNFSKKYLSKTRGVTQDEPLVLTSKLIPSEVDDMVFDMDIVWRYPLEFYEAAEQFKHPSEVKIKRVGDILHMPGDMHLGFTHDTTDLNDGARVSAYKSIPTMHEKVIGQMDLATKIRAVDENAVAKLIIERHFLRDIKGNLRQFSQQQFRCVACNEKFRRIPLKGACTACNGRIIFTVSEGTIIKYLKPSLEITKRYKLSPYLRQVLDILQEMIESIFGKEAEKQEALNRWF